MTTAVSLHRQPAVGNQTGARRNSDQFGAAFASVMESQHAASDTPSPVGKVANEMGGANPPNRHLRLEGASHKPEAPVASDRPSVHRSHSPPTRPGRVATNRAMLRQGPAGAPPQPSTPLGMEVCPVAPGEGHADPSDPLGAGDELDGESNSDLKYASSDAESQGPFSPPALVSPPALPSPPEVAGLPWFANASRWNPPEMPPGVVAKEVEGDTAWDSGSAAVEWPTGASKWRPPELPNRETAAQPYREPSAGASFEDPGALMSLGGARPPAPVIAEDSIKLATPLAATETPTALSVGPGESPLEKGRLTSKSIRETAAQPHREPSAGASFEDPGALMSLGRARSAAPVIAEDSIKLATPLAATETPTALSVGPGESPLEKRRLTSKSVDKDEAGSPVEASITSIAPGKAEPRVRISSSRVQSRGNVKEVPPAQGSSAPKREDDVEPTIESLSPEPLPTSVENALGVVHHPKTSVLELLGSEPKSPHATPLAKEPSDIDLSLKPPTPNTSLTTLSQAGRETIEQTRNQHLSAARPIRTIEIQTDVQSDVRISVQENGHRLTIRAELGSADTPALRSEWSDLQHRLAANQVDLQSLPSDRGIATNLPDGGFNPSNGRHGSGYDQAMADSTMRQRSHAPPPKNEKDSGSHLPSPDQRDSGPNSSRRSTEWWA